MVANGQSSLMQAKLNSLVRYAPQREALVNALREAQSNYQSSVAGAESVGRTSTAAIQKAVPLTQGIFNRAQGSTSAAQTQLAGVLAALGPQANGYKAAGATEAAAGQERLARERAAAESGLQTQAAAAAEAPQFARTLAGQQRDTSLSKILASLQGVAGQEGASTVSEADKLEREAAKDSLTERGQNITARGQNITAGSDAEGHALTRQGLSQKAQEHQETLAAAKAKGEGKGSYLPLDKQTAAASTLRTIEKEARAARGEGRTRGQIYSELTEAGQANTKPKMEKGKDGKLHQVEVNGKVQYETTPAPKAFDTLLSEAAIESVFNYGKVSKATLAKLHAQGYSVHHLGLGVASEQEEGQRKAQEIGRAVVQGARNKGL